MGKGDIKSRRGKFFAGSFGKRRPKKKKKTSTTTYIAPPPLPRPPVPEPEKKSLSPESTKTVARPVKKETTRKKTQTKGSGKNVEKDTHSEKE